MSKLPAIQFYPGDWRKDLGVQSLSYHDRGVWFEMLCLMHESEIRGKLMLGGRAMTDEILAGVLRIDAAVLSATLQTLISHGVTERDRSGALINRRMVRDENERAENRAKLNGWRKAKKLKGNGNEVETEMKPLSSSSTSSSTTEQEQVPSRARKARAKDPNCKTALAKGRHDEFHAAITAYWKHTNPGDDMPWDGAEGKALEMWLRASPKTTLDQFRRMLYNRSLSDVVQTERPSIWIRRVTNWAKGPLDRFNKPLDATGGTNGKGKGNLAALNEALAGTGFTADFDGPSGDGHLALDDRGQGNLETLLSAIVEGKA